MLYRVIESAKEFYILKTLQMLCVFGRYVIFKDILKCTTRERGYKRRKLYDFVLLVRRD